MTFETVARGLYLEGLFVDGEGAWTTDVIKGEVRRQADGRTWRAGTPYLAALLMNADGCMLSSGPGGIAWFDPASDKSGWLIGAAGGRPLVGVNEMTSDGAGGIYFGTVDLPAIERGEKPGPATLYRLDAEGRLTAVAENLVFSNGLSLSPDGRRLYHNESFHGVFVYEVAPDGSLGARTMLLEKPDCDGMALDVEGGVWISGFSSGELLRLTPDGSIDQRLALPGQAATNVFFGGADGRDLYVTTVSPETAAALAEGELPEAETSVLYRTRAEIPGLPVERPRFRLA
jgi:sugar lactone lactonase YvrE